MKNVLKRITIILPVIVLLLAFLAVPASADYSPETGWSEPVSSMDALSGELVIGFGGLDGVTPITEPFVIDGYYYIEIYFGESSIPSETVFPVSVWPGSVYVTMDNNSFFEFENVIVDENGDFTATSVVTGVVSNLDSFMLGETLPIVVKDYPPSFGVSESPLLPYLVFNVVTVGDVSVPSAVEPIGNVWTEIMTWITSALNSVMGAFYVDGSLTLLGTLAAIGVSVGIGFLLIAFIQRFLHLRG